MFKYVFGIETKNIYSRTKTENGTYLSPRRDLMTCT